MISRDEITVGLAGTTDLMKALCTVYIEITDPVSKEKVKNVIFFLTFVRLDCYSISPQEMDDETRQRLYDIFNEEEVYLENEENLPPDNERDEIINV